MYHENRIKLIKKHSKEEGDDDDRKDSAHQRQSQKIKQSSIKNESQRKKAAQEAKIVQENDLKQKYSVSIDQFRKQQKVKNPISSANLVLLSGVYFLSIAIAFPVSYLSIVKQNCDLEANYKYHLGYLLIVAVTLIISDISAVYQSEKIQDILLQQNFQFAESRKEHSLCQQLGSMIITLISIFCSATQIFELYSDLLIVWVPLFSPLPFTFGFFALTFPLLNRLMQIAVCIHMFIYGMKMRLKTIGSEKIDKHLIYLNLFNMSRLLFPNFYDQKPRFLMIILVKELALKLVQIILKLVLATQTLSNECGGNIGILVLLIVGNLFSLLQMIFFMTDRLTSTTYRKHEEGFRNLSDLDQYVRGGWQFEAVITNRNQDIMLKLMNAYVFKHQSKIRCINLSFQNQSALIQPQYREQMFKMLVNCQQYNQKFRELRLYDSNLGLKDFFQLRQVLTLIPKFECLHIENCVITEKEFECLEQLKYGIERNQNFRDLILKFKTKNKQQLFMGHFQSMYNLNKQVSISYVNDCTELSLPETVRQANKKKHNNQIQEKEQNMDEVAQIYDDLDLDFFISCRQSNKNHKLFIFRDWENLLRRLYLHKSKNLLLGDLQSIEVSKQTKFHRQQRAMFVDWITRMIEKNPQLVNANLRFMDESPAVEKEKNKMSLTFDELCEMLDEFISSEECQLEALALCYNSEAAIENPKKLTQILERVIALNNLKDISFENLNFARVDLFNVLGQNIPQLSSIRVVNGQVTDLNGILTLQQLRMLKLQKNQVKVSSVEELTFLILKLLYLEISDQPHFFIDAPIDLSLDCTACPMEFLILKSTSLTNDHLRFILTLMETQQTLKLLDVKDNLLTDDSVEHLASLSKKRPPLHTLDVSKNQLSAKGMVRILKAGVCEKLEIQENRVGIHALIQIAEVIGTKGCQVVELNMAKQVPKQRKKDEETIKRSISMRGFSQLVKLDISYMNMSNSCVLELLGQINISNLPIRDLDLSGNEVCQTGCKQLNKLAQRKKSLQILKLDSAHIQCVGLSYLWLAFSDTDDDLNLQTLSVKDNGINDQWARRLNYKLSQPIKVKNLDLSNNSFSNIAASEFRNYFLDNSTIENIYLCDNQFTREGLRKLKELIRLNPKLIGLHLKGNKEIEESVEMCERRMRSKETFQHIVYY